MAISIKESILRIESASINSKQWLIIDQLRPGSRRHSSSQYPSTPDMSPDIRTGSSNGPATATAATASVAFASPDSIPKSSPPALSSLSRSADEVLSIGNLGDVECGVGANPEIFEHDRQISLGIQEVFVEVDSERFGHDLQPVITHRFKR